MKLSDVIKQFVQEILAESGHSIPVAVNRSDARLLLMSNARRALPPVLDYLKALPAPESATDYLTTQGYIQEALALLIFWLGLEIGAGMPYNHKHIADSTWFREWATPRPLTSLPPLHDRQWAITWGQAVLVWHEESRA